MVNNNPTLTYLQSQLADLKSNQQRLVLQKKGVFPHDILTKDALENHICLVMEEIAQVEQEIQSWNDQLVRAKFDGLVDILKLNQITPEQIKQAYQNTLLHWYVKINQNVGDVRLIVTELNKIPQGSFSYSALDEFIANIFQKTSDITIIESLNQWGQEYRQGIDWLSLDDRIQQTQDRRLETVQPAILIAITRSDEVSTQAQDSEIYYQLEAWSIEDIETYRTKKIGFQPLLKADNSDAVPCLLAELLDNTTRLLKYFLNAQREHCKNCENYPEIHLFLPLELMHLGVDVWLLENSPRPKYLGHDYLVFIRCANRYDRNYSKAPSWRKLWKRHQNSLAESAQDVFVAGHDNDIDDLRDILDDRVKPDTLDSKVVGLYVTDAPVDIENLVYELLDAGLPLAIWSRCNLAESAHQIQMSALLAACCLADLPSQVQAKRFETRKQQHTPACHIGHHLSLLWDDPNFCPPKSA